MAKVQKGTVVTNKSDSHNSFTKVTHFQQKKTVIDYQKVFVVFTQQLIL